MGGLAIVSLHVQWGDDHVWFSRWFQLSSGVSLPPLPSLQRKRQWRRAEGLPGRLTAGTEACRLEVRPAQERGAAGFELGRGDGDAKHRHKERTRWDLPGSPVAETPCCQYRGPRFNP